MTAESEAVNCCPRRCRPSPHLLAQRAGKARFGVSYGRLVVTMNCSFLAWSPCYAWHGSARAAQNRDATLAALIKLPAAERQARLVEGAKKESGLVWYSSTTAEDALALSKKFNEQHPTIQINHFRSSSEKLLERILTESRANAFKADIVTPARVGVIGHDQAQAPGPL